MAIKDPKQLTGLEKAAILIVALGTRAAAQVFKYLSEPEVERLSAQIIKMRDVDPELTKAVVAEFEGIRTSLGSGSPAGKDFAAQVLEQVVGQERASELLDRAGALEYGRPFESLWDLDSSELARVLGREHPQVAALVLTYLPPEKAGAVLSELAGEMQPDVAHRICTMDEIEPTVLSAIEEALHARLTSASEQVVVSAGPKTLVEILNNASRSAERTILDALGSQDAAMGEQVRKMIFIFEDLPRLEDRTVQVVLREVDQEDLRLALKGADDTIKDLVFRNISERAAEMLKEDLELLGSVREQDVEAAQQRIVSAARRLIASGEAVLKSEEEQQEGEAVEQGDQVKAAA